ncbi:hypothetical protein N7540_012512 [Penicillium herquei]|nr:hypothetical protein N7540_012512 [Penicillium herquei]
MPPSTPTWDGVEIALLLCFDMWGIERNHIPAMLSSRVRRANFTRSHAAIASKLSHLRTTHPELWSPITNSWNLRLTSEFLFSQCTDHAQLRHLLYMTDEEIWAVAKVR